MNREEFTIIKDGVEVKLAVRPMTREDTQEAEKAYSARIAALVNESANSKKKILLRQQLDQFLKDQNLWSKKDEDKIQSIQKEIEKLISKLRKGGIRESEGRSIAVKIIDKRAEIDEMNARRSVFNDATAEYIANGERLEYGVYACTVNADTGEKYWDSFEAMKDDREGDTYFKASNIVMKIMYGFNPDFVRDYPETKWLLKHGFVNQELNYIDKKTGKLVDRDGKLISETIEKFNKIQDMVSGDITEEAPFIDDETNEPVILTA